MEESKRLFDAPIPGQSLTKAPKSSPWDQPPQFVEVDKALDHVWDNISRPDAAARIVETLRAGYDLDKPALSVQGIANVIAMGGFTEGKWTPDVAELMKPTIMTQIAGIAADAGLDKFNTYLPTQRDAMTDFMGGIQKMYDDHDKLQGQMASQTMQGSEGNDRFSYGPIIGDEGIRDEFTPFSPSSIPDKPSLGGLAGRGLKKPVEPLLDMITRHEGERLRKYNDGLGKATVGVGFNMDDSTARRTWKAAGVPEDFNKVKSGRQAISQDSSRKLLEETVKVAEKTANKLVKNLDKHPEAVQNVVKNLSFQLGETKLRKFENMLEALNAKDYDKAADELLDSKLTSKRNPKVLPGVEKRANELADILREYK